MISTAKASRGKLRNITMTELNEVANDPLWEEAQNSSLIYDYPVSANDLENNQAAIQKLTKGIPVAELIRVGPFITARSPESHIGPYRWAIDFLVPDGTPVLASQDGKIIEVIEDQTLWGDGAEFRDKLNYLTLEHQGEYSQYCHLAAGSVSEQKLRVGDRVWKGKRIGTVGKTGWTDRDHLHFIVFRGVPEYVPRFGKEFGFRSLKVRFNDSSNK